jgi:D-sedoheptulose 7-phosphate isomerase
MGNLRKDLPRRGLAAIALTVDTSFLTAYANDSGFELIFERQVQALGNEGDVLVAISTSGKSPNVLRALDAARAAKIKTILLSSSAAPNVASADIAIAVPSHDTQHIQEAHLAIEHLICELVETNLFVAPTPE